MSLSRDSAGPATTSTSPSSTKAAAAAAAATALHNHLNNLSTMTQQQPLSLSSSPEMDDYGPHNLVSSGDAATHPGSLSFENPNYAMADCINSNVPVSVLEELSRRHELDTIAKKRSSNASSVGSGDSSSARR